MKCIILISIVLAVLCTVVGARISGGLFRDPKNPGKCTLDESIILEQGETLKNPQGECALITCFENGQASIVGCVPQGMREGCKEGSVLYPDAKFPECCKREITCDRFYYSQDY